jgi:predicted acyl esterase
MSVKPLTAPLRVSGVPEVNLYASTSGSDSDWVVKLIDVYPDSVPSEPVMGGYELAISLDIFRGRYRTSFEHPEAIALESAAALSLRLAEREPCFLAGTSHHGPGAIDSVSALRPQPADICAKYFRRQVRGLSVGNAARLAYARHRQFHQPAGCALSASLASRLSLPMSKIDIGNFRG